VTFRNTHRLARAAGLAIVCAVGTWSCTACMTRGAGADAATGEWPWQVPLGTLEGFGGNHGVPPGGISLGGPIATAGGLVFIAGTLDPHLRAFDVETGRELWSAELPAAGNATRMTYKVSAAGKQYVVIAAGGHAKVSESRIGDTLVAFALP